RRAGVEPAAVQEVIMGNVLQGGVGQAPARQAAIHAGLPGTVPAMTINKVCGSGLKAVMLAAQAIKAGDAQCVVSGGMESMSNAPHYVYGMRGGIKLGNRELVDGMIRDGLWDSFSDVHMGSLAEYTAQKAAVSRADQDRFALASHQKAVAAMTACRFKAEIVPVEVPGRGTPTLIEKDEGPRKDTSLEALAALKPSFEPGGSVTPGNAPGLNDGASALVVASLAFAKAHGLEALARITGYATGGGEPKDLFFAPIVAVKNLMANAKTTIDDYDLIEANEAFAVQALADGRALAWDWERVNVNGGAIAPQIAVPLPGTPVPMTLQPLAVLLVGGWLGAGLGAGSLVFYLLLGAAGLPVFTPYGLPGIARLLGPTGGYLLAYPVAAFAVGRVVGATDPGRKLGVARLSLAVFTGLVLIHLGGLAQLLILTGSATGALRLGTLPFLAGDLMKVAIAVLALTPTVSPLRARL